jgi:hypothetical protein
VTWCNTQFSAFNDKIKLDATRRGRIDSAISAFTDFCRSDKELSIAADGAPFLQGSVGTNTAIKPLGGDEFDVDVIFPFKLSVFKAGITPNEIVNWFLSRLRTSEFYKKNLIPKDRCARINYAGDFHVDIIPSTRQIQAVQPYAVPARDLGGWIPNNPMEFANWVRAIDGKGGGVDADGVGYFVRSIRIMKRWRDEFLGDAGPSSMLLVTFLGNHEPTRTYSPPIDNPLFAEYKQQAAYLYDMLRLTHSCLLGSAGRDVPFLNPVILTEDLGRGWQNKHLGAFLEELADCIEQLRLAIYEKSEAASMAYYRAAFGSSFPAS